MAYILVNGTFKNNTQSGVIAEASQIGAGNVKQSDLNTSFASRISDLENSGGSGGGGGSSADISNLENRITALESGAGLSSTYRNYQEGGYFNADGAGVTDKDYGWEETYIPVTNGATYTFNLGKAGTMGKTAANIILYKETNGTKTKIDYKQCNLDTRTITMSSSSGTVAYIRLSFPLGHTDEVSVLDSSDNVIWQAQSLAVSPVELLNKDRLVLRNVYSNMSDLRLLFFSDIHGDILSFERIIEMANGWILGDGKFGHHIDAVLNGGDTVKKTLGDDYTWYNNLVPTLNVPLLTALGNHDTNVDYVAVSEETAYNALMAASMSRLSSLVGNKLSHTGTKSYYYVDFDSHISGSANKIRVFVLSCMNTGSYWDSTEEQWFVDNLADANTNGYYVMVLTHSAPFKTEVSIINCNFSNTSKAYDTENWKLVQSAVTAVQNFIDNNGKFICWLCGHSHNDWFLYPQYGSTVYNKQPMFVTDCANSVQTMDGKPYFTHDKGDVFRDVFNYITVDLTNSIFRIVRIGKNYDGRLVSKTGMEYNFSTNQVTKQW